MQIHDRSPQHRHRHQTQFNRYYLLSQCTPHNPHVRGVGFQSVSSFSIPTVYGIVFRSVHNAGTAYYYLIRLVQMFEEWVANRQPQIAHVN